MSYSGLFLEIFIFQSKQANKAKKIRKEMIEIEKVYYGIGSGNDQFSLYFV